MKANIEFAWIGQSGPNGFAVAIGYGGTGPALGSIHNIVTAISFKLAGIPGPKGKVCWKAIKANE